MLSLRAPAGAAAVAVAGAVAVAVAAGAAAIPAATGALAQAGSPEARAVVFLSREVPRWKADNDCYSCHNNGDAARALIAAAARGHVVGGAIDDTLEWLRQPQKWAHNKTQGGIDDKPLARIQFASALRRAVEARRASTDALASAAALVAADQQPDGSWQLDTSQSLGSPATYGTTLATATARRILAAANQRELAPASQRADAWLRTASVASVIDAASVVIGLDRDADTGARAQRQRALATVKRGQGTDGGWGPYVTVRAEVFDTALAVLSLTRLNAAPDLAAPVYTAAQLAEAIARGRAFLTAAQSPEGSWPETTRPSGQESYAQRISTTGWALIALLESR